MSNATMMNGQTRKSLSDQIDRLDGILEGLAEALNESVADAVRDVVGQVVRTTVEASIKEVLASPELLRAALDRHAPAQAEPQPAVKRPGLVSVLKGALAGLLALGGQGMEGTRHVLSLGWRSCLSKVGQLCNAVKDAVSGGARLCLTLLGQGWQNRRSCSLALGLGVLSGLGSYYAGPLASAVLCGLSGTGLALSGSLLWPFLSLLGGLSHQD